ncbi:MAG: enoyl-CoA hydratase/isomerase family protein [Proteobacteria bacterium]|nr:enoyl-CoA hydratase/isomerase family protein [Pseudomonadota bacterium]
MSTAPTTINIDIQGGVARVTLARPEVHNAFNDTMICELRHAFTDLGRRDDVRVVVLAGEGRSFSAGADVEWMRSAAQRTEAENLEDAGRMAAMLGAIDGCPKPVVVRVQGAALGGGVGLMACADIVVATRDARVGTTEVRLGILPAVISPFVLRKIGYGRARAHFLMGDRFDAAWAFEIGLVHRLVEQEADLDGAVNEVVAQLLAGSPAAQAETKRLLGRLLEASTPEAQTPITVETIARVRVSDEGREGLGAFLEKRKPRWLV